MAFFVGSLLQTALLWRRAKVSKKEAYGDADRRVIMIGGGIALDSWSMLEGTKLHQTASDDKQGWLRYA